MKSILKNLILVVACFFVMNANYALTIVRTDDPSVATNLSASDKIKADAAFDYAARLIAAHYNDPIQINITFAASTSSSVFGESSAWLYGTYTYDQITAMLAAVANHSDPNDVTSVANFAASDPSGNAMGYYITRSQAKSLGQISSDAAEDGTFTFGTTFSYTYDSLNRAISGKYDFIGIALHEITEIMGRIPGLGSYSTFNMLYDIFRYTAPGVHSFDINDNNVYFSINNGTTNLKNYNFTNSNGSDPQDWASGANDACNAFSSSNTLNDLTPVDIKVMDVIGYSLVSPCSNPPTPVITSNGSDTICSGSSVTLDAGTSPSYAGYLWSTTATTETISATSAGTYTVTVTDTSGCTGTASQTVVVNASPTPQILAGSDTIFCQGDSVSLDAGNFNLHSFVPYSAYIWNSGQTVENITVYNAALYTVNVTDANGCTGTGSINVVVNPAANPTITSNEPFVSCNGGQDTLRVGAFSSYHWSTGNIGDTIHVGLAATYSVTVTNGNGCTGTSSVFINLHTGPTPVITGDTTICSDDGVTVFDAGSGYASYLWNVGSTNEIVLTATPGVYSVTVTDNNGCTGTASVTFTINPSPNPTITTNTGLPDLCSNGSLNLDAGNFPSYIWSTGETTEIISINSASTFTVTVTDANGCTGVDSIATTVFASPAPVITASGPTSFCIGDSVTLDVGSYTTIQWSTGGNDSTITVYTTNNYSVTVSNSIGCTAVASQMVTENANPTPSITASPSNNICAGSFVTLDAGSYAAYQWSDGDMTETTDVTSANTYYVTVTDTNSCVGMDSAIIGLVANPTPTIDTSGPTTFCSGGSVILDAGSFYSYMWSNGGTDETVVATTQGVYEVTVSDPNGCTGVAAQIVAVNPPFTPIIAANGPTTFCAGGSVTLDAGIYVSYIWNTVANTEMITVNTTGNYSVTVTDGNGCTGIASQAVTVNANPSPVINPSGTTTFCSNSPITLDAGLYASYFWNTTETTEVVNDNTGGMFMLTVTDANGCTGMASISTTENTSPTPSITPNSTTTFCMGGSVTLDAGLFASYMWSNGGTDETTNATTNGNYFVTVTDGNGCTGVASQMVTVYTNPTPTITPNGPVAFCTGGSVILDAGSYVSYLWSTSDITETITASTTGTYIVTVTDGNGCTGSASQNVSATTNITNVITPNGPITFCIGGSVTLDAGNYASYIWSTTDVSETINVTSSGTYTVTVTLYAGCTGSASQTVTVNSLATPTITAIGSLSFCQGGSATLDAGAFISFLWNNGATSETVSATDSIIYSVTVTDGNGCTGVASQLVTVYSNPTPTIIPEGPTTFCNGGDVVLDAGPGYSSYSWSDGDVTETTDVLNSGLMNVTVTDGNGCSGTDTITITINTAPTPIITHTTPVTFCQGDSVILHNAFVYSSYMWSTGATTRNITEYASGTYTVTATDFDGCTGTTSITVTVNTNPTPSITSNGPTIFCFGGSVSLDAGSGYAAYSWNNSSTTEMTNATDSANYIVIVTDNIGCTGTASLLVTAYSLPNVHITPNGRTNFCTGGNVTLDAGIFTSYAWNTSETTEAITVDTTGTYVVTVTNAYGCSNTASQNVVVSLNITFSIIPSGPTTFCAGDSVSLDAGLYNSYIWNNTDTTESITVMTSGTFSVTISGANGCTGVASISTIENPLPTPTITPNGATSFCNGGSVSLDAGTYISYVWNTTATTEAITASTSGSYSVTVTDGNGCMGNTSQTVIVYNNPTPSITHNNHTTFCQGGSTTLDAGSYSSFLWNTSETTEAITVDTAGTFMVTVTDSNGCLGMASQVIVVNPLPTPSITPSSSTSFCNGGSVSLDAGTYSSYLWTTSGTTESITVSTNGTFTVTVTDNNGCTGTTSQAVVVFNNPNPTITPNGSTSFCNGGSVDLDAGSYVSFLWNTGATDEIVTENSTGTYLVTVTDGNGCMGVDSIHITVFNNPTPVITSGGPTTICSGDSVSLSAGIYSSYIWNTLATTETIFASTQTTFTVTVTDIHGCTGSTSQAVIVNPNPTASINTNGPTSFCQGGSVILNSNTANAYFWNTGATTDSITAIVTGVYSVTISNGFNCTASTSQVITVSANPSPVIFDNGDTTFCFGGSVSLNAGVWTSYIWSTGSTLDTITVNTSATYIVTVSNAGGCTGSASRIVTVNSNPSPSITPSTTTTFCQGGSVFLNVGNSFTTYLWNIGATTGLISATTNGTYTITVSNASNCTATATINVTVNPNPVASINASGPTTFCNGGSVDLTAMPNGLSYSWSNATTNQSIPNITTNGTFTVTVIDGNGCSDTASQAVTVNALPVPSIISNGPTTFCSGPTDTLDAGSFASYHWSTGESTEKIGVASSSTYIVTVTNAGNCIATAQMIITVNLTPSPSITASGPVTFCIGGSVNLTVGVFTTYLWSTGSTSETISGITASGDYIVTVSSTAGCTATASQVVTVNVSPTPVIVANGSTSFCLGGSVVLNAGSGYTNYLWSTNATIDSIIVNTSGNFFVTVTNNNGCTGTATQSVTVNPLPTPTITANGPTTFCAGNNLILDAGPWSTYTWSNADTTETISVTATGLYTVTISNNNGCTASVSESITVNPLPVVTDTSTLTNVCNTWAPFALNGGTPVGGTYSGVGITLSPTFNPAILGVHTITYTYTNGNGCTNSITHNITVNDCTDIPTITNADFIKVYPNPNNGNFTLTYDVSSPITALKIMDVTGRIVLSQSITGMTGSQSIDASTLSSGLYYWEVISGEGLQILHSGDKGKMIIVK